MTATLEPTITAADVTAAAWAWHSAGYAVVPIKANGEKRPDGKWKQYQYEQPTDRQMQEWFGGQRRTGLGLVCGAVSGGLEMFELEGRCVADGAREKLVPALKAAGVFDVWKRLINGGGYAEWSPTGGLHLLYRLTDREVPGNTPVAQRPAREDELTADELEIRRKNPSKVFRRVLAETRGEGGFVVVAPSHGTTHGSGLPWSFAGSAQPGQVPTITWDERVALFAVVHAVLDEMPAPEPPRPRTPRQRDDIGDRPGDLWAAQTDWPDVLGPHGWQHVYQRGDMDYWRRPGKNLGWSARTGGRHDGLYVWTTSSEFPAEVHISKFRAFAILNHGGNDSDAASELRRLGFGNDRSRPVAANPAPAPVAVAQPEPPPPVDDSDTKPTELVRLPNLPQSFWEARPQLGKIRDAAYHVGYSADAVLGAVLARGSAMAHHKLVFDFGRGAGSLNLFVNLLGPSGFGKTKAVEVAQELILPPSFLAHVNGEVDQERFKDSVGLGTGEGMSEVFMGVIDRETGEIHRSGPNKGDPKTEKVRAQVRHNAFFYIDEGETLSKMMRERQGAIIAPTIRTAWVGGTLGQTNAREETTRLIPKRSYSLGMVIGYQPDVAQDLLADSGPGTPQRFLWLSAVDPHVTDEAPDLPAPFRLPLCDGNRQPVTGTITCYPDLRAQLRREHLAKVRGEAIVAELDAHASLMKCKVAALLAILDDRKHVTEDDWALAGVVWETSCAIRDRLIEFGKQKAAQDHEQRTAVYVDREVRAHAAKREADSNVERIARWIGRRIHEGGSATKGATRKAAAGRDKPLFEPALLHAVQQGWVVVADDDRELMPGDARPV
ncbi:Bifunctional DNA primase/polymerase, N-terminal [Micromonospora nigra]|uniref:Bifunctional DNA primase/polymerase, N-terminal n=1 Tax=Micromonospora nigra TaxID=145857 RepID=A0A1C6RKS8_9ACTN|nr:bifunctional DNA primase/polymerase [Micromonospora nigra]SCL17708.1 Bifunctional DNA primase/polymerase, N-terminal [Micromonospora nigra]